MAHETNFNDALDYIYIANSMNDKAYLIADPQPDPKDDNDDDNHVLLNEEEEEGDEEDDLEENSKNNNNSNNHHYYNDDNDLPTVRSLDGIIPNTDTSTSSPLATAAFAAAAASASVAAVAARITAKAAHRSLANNRATAASTIQLIDVDNNYTNVAVGLGAMLLNDTLLLEGNVNDTALSIFGEFVNRSGQLANDSTAINVTASKVDVDAEDDFTQLLRMAVTSVLLGLMILVTIIGNVFVIAAIILERNLQNVANYLVASLAVADLFVACLVMPLGAVYEISQGWILGPELCDIWTSCDVLCCTASILHLVAIAVDRYWAVTNIDYIHSRTSNRVFMMIFCVWTAAVIVSLAPQFGWKDPDYLQRIEQQKCMVSQDVAYQVFATCCTFYVPLLVILALYWKIYQTARKRIHRRRPRPVDVAVNNNQPDSSAATATDTKLNRLRLRLGRFSTAKNKGGSGATACGGGASGTALGLVEGNSTNTVNTVEDTEFSSSNVDSKSRAGIEAPSTSGGSQIATVSHLVALAKQQGKAATKPLATTPAGGEKATESGQTSEREATTTTATSAAVLTDGHNEQNQANGEAGAAAEAATASASADGVVSASSSAVEVLEDPHLQQQLEQVQQQLQKTAKTAGGGGGGGGGGGASTSNATTITSISALSPTTPPPPPPPASTQASAGPMTAKTSTLTSCNQAHPLCSSVSSVPVTPETRTKQPPTASPAPTTHHQHQQQLSSIANPMQKVNKRKETLEAKRERKAAKTLAIITGAFVVCWLPFFVMALTMSLCKECEMAISDTVASLFLWLGYFNSTLNPVIYTIFSPEFRQAFKRILFGGHRPVHYRSGKL
ncbi:5-hydroxytryptamine receptor 2A isoform X1 [Drosophila willistoni]|uniref:5-hydroxytryptamine receptor 2A isoform X1 n=2 Tax=Drosophila willistoni TaxID=7260 RepID=UPI001F077D47|nr:5-hydroxytryptamine receptor 2A isoform X1 [Drosophila willistoni]